MTPSDVCVALLTAPDLETAESLVRLLVEERHAACGSILPGVTSVYRWEGQLQRETEVLVILKTTREKAPSLIRRTAERHPFDVPEILVLPVSEGFSPYLDWVRAETST